MPDDSLRSDSDQADGNTPPSSGATTPTAATGNGRSRSLLGIYPLSGFFRARSSSLASSTKSVAETCEEISDLRSTSPNPSDGRDDDDDRRTIRGDDDDGERDRKLVTNGNSGAHELGQGEKARTIRPTPSHSVAPNAV